MHYRKLRGGVHEIKYQRINLRTSYNSNKYEQGAIMSFKSAVLLQLFLQHIPAGLYLVYLFNFSSSNLDSALMKSVF